MRGAGVHTFVMSLYTGGIKRVLYYVASYQATLCGADVAQR